MVQLNNTNFENEIVNYQGSVLVDFWGENCGYCKMLEPVFNEIANEYSDKVKFAHVHINKSMDLAEKFDINTIPTVILFENGKEIKRFVGFQPKEKLIAYFNL